MYSRPCLVTNPPLRFFVCGVALLRVGYCARRCQRLWRADIGAFARGHGRLGRVGGTRYACCHGGIFVAAGACAPTLNA